MKTITFTCETITPMFLSGADGQTPELRPPSIKGALRFWWRAMNGHLGLTELKKQESLIFGGTDGDSGGRSRILIRIKNHLETEKQLQKSETKLTPRAGKNFTKLAFDEKQKFTILLSTTDEKVISEIHLTNLFIITCALGGFGGRKNRGFGSIQITNHPMPENIDDILTCLGKLIDKKYFIKAKDTQGKDCIYSNFGKNEPYPYIKQIQVGKQRNKLLEDVAQTQHQLSERDYKSQKYEYGASLGDAKGMRFSSPIKVSTIFKNKQWHSIIVTLNTVPEKYKHKINVDLQEEFKNQIL
jgi:CRISPR-associated protein Cmr1